jgi:hypothetical protein
VRTTGDGVFGIRYPPREKTGDMAFFRNTLLQNEAGYFQLQIRGIFRKKDESGL